VQESVCIWAIKRSFLDTKSSSIENSFINISEGLIDQLRVGHWILVFNFEMKISKAQVVQIGVIENIDEEAGKISVNIVSTNFPVTPNYGKAPWRDKDYFHLDPGRAYSYEIPKRFAEYFNEESFINIKVVKPPRSKLGQSLHKERGFVYIWQSGNEYKIGRSKNVEDRMERVSRETGRDIIEIHRISSSDYTNAEKRLHKCFQEKRLYGEAGIEWFLLDPEDVEWLKSITVFEDIKDEIS